MPNFISSSPIGQDQLEGKSHEKIAETIKDLFLSNTLHNNVIGLEGKWGSGKSNVISILKNSLKKEDKDYFFFTYDAWGHQEDLTRRTFLEDLISKLKNENKFEKKFNWEKELKRLLATKSNTTTKTNPEIKFYWILIMGSILLFTFLDILYEDFVNTSNSVIDGSNIYVKLGWKYLLPVLIFFKGVYELFQEYQALEFEEETKDLSKRDKLKRLFYIFSGTHSTSEEHEHILEEEPSVSRFKEYFFKIKNHIKTDGLIIVFDNMDRLSDREKVLSLWSSVYTFFSEDKDENIWIIIPYDKSHLALHFDDFEQAQGNVKNQSISAVDNFIGKTFSTTFRISPPVLSDWKKFFELKYKEAFDEEYDLNQIEFISTLYELTTFKKTPRDIISFINSVVTLRLQHDKSIKMKYLALFVIKKDEILNNPLTTISNKEFISSVNFLFNDSKELEQSLGAIVYNVDLDKANEVLLKNNLQEVIYGEDLETFEEITSHSQFKTYFDDFIYRSNLSNINPETITNVLLKIEDVVSEYKLKEYWRKFGRSINESNSEDYELKPWMEKAFKKIPLKSAENKLNSILFRVESDPKSKNDPLNYHRAVYKIANFQKTQLGGIVTKHRPKKYSPEGFIKVIQDYLENLSFEKVNLDELGIYVSNSDFNQYFLNHPNGLPDAAFEIYDVLKFITENLELDFTELKEALKNRTEKIGHTDKVSIDKLISLNILFSEDNKIPKFSLATGNNYLAQPNAESEESYYYIVSNQISHMLNNGNPHQSLLRELNRQTSVDHTVPIIRYFISYGDLLKLFINKKKTQPLIKSLIFELTNPTYNYPRNIDTKWVFENLNQIKDQLFPDNFKDFLNSFDKWNNSFSIKEDYQINDFEQSIIEIALDDNYSEFKSIQTLQELILKDFENSDKSKWLKEFQGNSSFNFAFKEMVSKNKLNTSVTKGKEFMDAFGEYTLLIAKREIAVPDSTDIWNKLIIEDYLDKRKVGLIFNGVLDHILSHIDIEMDEVDFFYPGLILYSTRLQTENIADEFIRKLILPLEDYSNRLKTILNNYKNELIEIFNQSSNQYDQNLYDLFVKAFDEEWIDQDYFDEFIKNLDFEMERKDS